MKNFPFLKYSKLYYLLSGILIISSIFCLAFFGLKFGIEFKGGSSWEIDFLEKRPSNEEIREALKDFNLGNIIIKSLGERGVILQFREINEELHQQILSHLKNSFPLEEKNFQYIGPSVGRELRNKTQLAIFVALISIGLYIAFSFRKASRPVESWKYGLIALTALAQDVLIPLALFSVLGKLYDVEINIPVVAALLTVLGFSVHDTIIIFDRIRENILREGKENFEEIVNKSLNQTFGRSLSTVITTLFPLFTIYFLGGETLKYFALASIVGIICGTYSSIFLAGPLLVTWYKKRL